jgi:hypothetical protein
MLPDIAPEPSSIPVNVEEPCTGVVYDGYLHGCVVYLDVNGNKQRDNGEPFAVSAMGMFSIQVPGSNLTDAVFRMEPATSRGRVSQGADSCHDISTLMPERLPLAAKAPESCGPDAEPIVLSPLTTLATLVGQSQVEDVLELPPGLLGSDTLRTALDGSLDALRIMRREVQVKNMVSMVTSAVTSNQTAYSRIAGAAFRQLGNLFASPQDDLDEPVSGPPSGGGITSRRMLLQSSTTPPAEALAFSSIFQGVYATLAADPEINLSDMTFVSNETILAVATSIAIFNDLSDSLVSSVQDVYRMVILMESQLLPAIQSLAAGETTLDDFSQSNTLDMMIRSFEETSLPEGSIPDPLSAAPSPGPAPGPQPNEQQREQGSSSSLKLGLGLGLGLGLPVAAAAAALVIRWRRRAATRQAETAFVSTTGLSGGRSSKVRAPSPSVAVTEIVAASAGSRSPNANVV